MKKRLALSVFGGWARGHWRSICLLALFWLASALTVGMEGCAGDSSPAFQPDISMVLCLTRYLLFARDCE